MGIEQFEIVESNFSLKYTSKYELSILLGVDSFVYMVSNTNREILLMGNHTYAPSLSHKKQKSLPDIWKSIVEDNKYLKQSYNIVRIGLFSDVFTLVPDRLFDPLDSRVILAQLSPDLKTQEVKSDRITNLPIHNVYTLSPDLIKFTRSFFPESQLFEINSSLIPTLQHFAVQENASSIYVYVTEQQIRIFYFEEGNIVLANSYDYQTTNDFVYFTLLPFHHFDISPETQTIYLFGLINEEGELYRSLSRYIKKIEFLKFPSYLKIGPDLKTMPEHFFIDITSSLILN